MKIKIFTDCTMCFNHKELDVDLPHTVMHDCELCGSKGTMHIESIEALYKACDNCWGIGDMDNIMIRRG